MKNLPDIQKVIESQLLTIQKLAQDNHLYIIIGGGVTVFIGVFFFLKMLVR